MSKILTEKINKLMDNPLINKSKLSKALFQCDSAKEAYLKMKGRRNRGKPQYKLEELLQAKEDLLQLQSDISSLIEYEYKLIEIGLIKSTK